MSLYSIETHGQLKPALDLEWLLTNGLGGFASSTVVGCNTRRYHGLLCAALLPPVGRVMTLNRIGEILILDGQTDHACEFSVNQFGQTFHPRGDQYLTRFELDRTARWEFLADGVRVIKELQIVRDRNIVGIRYTVQPTAQRQVELRLLPFVSLRDFHALRRVAGTNLQISGMGRQVTIAEGPRTLYIQSDAADFVPRGDWWYSHTYALETERGQDDTEDLFTPGPFVWRSSSPGTLTLWAGTEPPGLRDWDEELHRSAAPSLPGPPLPSASTPGKLSRAAADFVVKRTRPDGTPGRTLMAGYPWFADWGRDAMIALPGLLLCTGRFQEAAEVLGVFAQYVSQGMIPNRFDDYTNQPHYNTVDASLWFIHAAFEFARLSGDRATFEKSLRPACEAIIEGYQRGTRFKIAMDPDDMLIRAGDADTQLTWMDAKCGGIAFTPRHGKAVEINALWYHALMLTGKEQLAAQVAASFVRKFWIDAPRGLYDVVNDHGPDASLRPNQIFAVSLPHSPLDRARQNAVVNVVRQKLLTPYGLRTLAPEDPRYVGRYTGDQMRRDAAYHNGTVWPWLMGPYLSAYLRVHDSAPAAVHQARQWLAPLLDHLEHQACIGQISEIFDGDEPHRPVGCFAQAWSVAEVLRLAVELGM